MQPEPSDWMAGNRRTAPMVPKSAARAVCDEMARMWTMKAQLPPSVEIHGWRLSVNQRRIMDRHRMTALNIATGETISSFQGLRRHFGIEEADIGCISTPSSASASCSTAPVPITPAKRPCDAVADDGDGMDEAITAKPITRAQGRPERHALRDCPASGFGVGTRVLAKGQTDGVPCEFAGEIVRTLDSGLVCVQFDDGDENILSLAGLKVAAPASCCPGGSLAPSTGLSVIAAAKPSCMVVRPQHAPTKRPRKVGAYCGRTIMHKGFAAAITDKPVDGARLPPGQQLAVYFEDYDGWYLGSLEEATRVGCGARVHFDDGYSDDHFPLHSQGYGRYNLWVIPNSLQHEEAWLECGHALLGLTSSYEGWHGLLRMWCAARHLFSMSVRDDVDASIEHELLVPELQAAQSVNVPSATMERIPALLHTLRETIVEEVGSTKRALRVSQGVAGNCRTESLAALIGLSGKQYYHFVRYIERGDVPMESPNTALYLAAIGLATQVCTCSLRARHSPPRHLDSHFLVTAPPATRRTARAARLI